MAPGTATGFAQMSPVSCRASPGVRPRTRPAASGLLTLVLAALSAVMPAAAGELRVSFAPNMGTLPIYAAQERGLFAAEGLVVRPVECQFGKECLSQLLAGQAQLATVADLPLVFAAFAGQRYAVLATLNTNRDDTKLVARRSSGITGTRDLVRRRVGTLLGTTAQYALDSMLLFEGVDPAGVQVVGLPLDELRPALLARRVDAISVFEPWALDLAQALGADALTIGTQGIYTQTWNLVGLPQPAGSPQAEVVSFLRALRHASDWIAREPAAAKALLRRRLGVGAELTEAAWSSMSYQISLKQSLLTTLEGEARWALRTGLVTGSQPNFLNHVDPAPLRAVHQDAITLAK